MPDITQAIFSITDDFEAIDPAVLTEEAGGGGGGGGHHGSKTAKAIQKNIVTNANKKHLDEVTRGLKSVLKDFPEFKNDSDKDKFLDKYIGWVRACLEMKQTIIRKEDLDFDTFRSGGPGGQHVNTTDSGVRATHLVTNISVTNTKSKEQLRNKEASLELLTDRLDDHIGDWQRYLELVEKELDLDLLITLMS